MASCPHLPSCLELGINKLLHQAQMNIFGSCSRHWPSGSKINVRFPDCISHSHLQVGVS